MITERHANECIMINERHNAYDELQGIGAYITSPRRHVGVLVHGEPAKQTHKSEINHEEPMDHGQSAWLDTRKIGAHDTATTKKKKCARNFPLKWTKTM